MTDQVRAVAAEIDRAVAGRTLLDTFAETVRRHGDVPALRWRSGPAATSPAASSAPGPVPAGQWQTLTWREYRDLVEAATLGLREHGLRPGERVAILATNRPELAIADLAVLHARAVPVCLFSSFTDEQLATVLRSLDISFVIVEGATELGRLGRAVDRPLRTVVFEPDACAGEVVPWETVLAAGRARAAAGDGAFEECRRAAHPDDVVTVNYTSGTTGALKGVQHTHRNVLWHAESFARFVDVAPGTRVLAYLPRAHATERFASTWFPLTRGATVHLCPDPMLLGEYLPQVRPEFFGGVLRVWEKMYAATVAAIAAQPGAGALVSAAVGAGRAAAGARQRGQRLSVRQRAALWAARPVLARVRARMGLGECRFAFSGGGALAGEIQEFFTAIGVPLAEGWGQSELVSAATCSPPDDIRLGTVGRPLPGVAVRVAADGELLVRCGSRMLGYADPAVGVARVDADGWSHTGDLGAIDADGRVRVLGRREDVVELADGYAVSATRVESQLKANLLIDHACVVGAGRPELCALVVPAARAGVDELVRAVREANRHLPARERIARIALLAGPWELGRAEELTHTGKLRRSFITAKYADLIDAVYDGTFGMPVAAVPAGRTEPGADSARIRTT